MTTLEELCGFVATVARKISPPGVTVTCRVGEDPDCIECHFRRRVGNRLFDCRATFSRIELVACRPERMSMVIPLRIRHALAELESAAGAPAG